MVQTTVRITDPLPNLTEEETAFLLDGTLRVAVSVIITRDPVHSELTALAKARAIDEQGQTMLDSHDQPIQTAHARSCPANMINDESVGGQAGLAREAVLLVLGDDEVALGEADNNIRHTWAAAQVTGAITVPDLNVPA